MSTSSMTMLQQSAAALAMAAGFANGIAPQATHPEWGASTAASMEAPAGYGYTTSGVLAPTGVLEQAAKSASSPFHRVTQPNVTRRAIYKDALASADQVNELSARELRGISRYLVENEPTYRACLTNWVELGFSGDFHVTSTISPQELADVGIEVSEEELALFQRGAKRVWDGFSANPLRSGQMPLGELIPMAVASEYVDGDIYFVASMRPKDRARPKLKRGPLMRFCWEAVEAPQIADDLHVADVAEGNTVSGGVERAPSGELEALHVYRRHPGDSATLMGGRFGSNDDPFAQYLPEGERRRAGAFDVVRIPWYDKDGRKNVVPLMQHERPGQSRGLPRMRSAMGAALDAGEARDAGIVLAKVAAMFSVFITEDVGASAPQTRTGLNVKDPAAGAPAGADPRNYEPIAPGMVKYLRPGQKVQNGQPPQFSPLVGGLTDSLTVLMASSIGLSYELVTGDFRKTTYSSARAAIETAWPAIRRMQDIVIKTLITESYCRVIEEAVIRGIIVMPGAKQAVLEKRDPFGDGFDQWCSIDVAPPAPPRIDVAKEIDGYIKAIEAKLTTRTHAAKQFFGKDFQSTVEVYSRDEQTLQRASLSSTAQPPREGDGDDPDRRDREERDEMGALSGQSNLLGVV